MSKLYNENKIIKLDPLGAALDEAGYKGGVGRINRLRLRNVKKQIQKTPDKKFKEDKTYALSTGTGGKIVSGKKNKKDAIKQQIIKANKFTAKGDEYPGLKKGGRVRDKQPPKTKKYFRSTKSGAGMTKAGVARYRRENPGSKLKTAVTGKVKPGSKAAKRRKSFCARTAGQMKKFPKAAADPNSRLRQARRRWKC